MKKLALILLLFPLLFSVAISFSFFGYDGWTLCSIKGIGEFKLSSKLEVQSGSYKAFVDKMNTALGYEYASDYLLLQQKGLNSLDSASLKTYVRFIISTDYSETPIYGTLTSPIILTPSDSPETKKELDSTFRAQAVANLELGSKLISWGGVSSAKYNGMSCTKISYQRQLGKNPIVVVNMMLFENRTRIHTVTTSYRVDQQTRWKSLIDSTLNTVKFYSGK